ncbi:hypothetical protein [Streptomyces sp. YIM 98790]|uniref:hypothetical protein n=1 Tax=Streptomyces sp. YIM 98790 TaxID=2689077 RepID=UPI00140B1890|nr:hypothetical protein [Streptomyces sp. YIM 98790]
MHRTARAAVTAGASALLLASATLLAAPASADPQDCVTGVTHNGTYAYAECPPGAGDFEFRVVAEGAGVSGLHTVHGPWRRPAGEVAVRSGAGCHYAPKCAVIGVTIEFR